MKRNDINELASKTVVELHKQLQELNNQLALARMDKVARKPLKNGLPSAISDDIARVKTILVVKQKAEKIAKTTTKVESKKEKTKETSKK